MAAMALKRNAVLRQLERLNILTDVTLTGRVLGYGSYGSVEEVSIASFDQIFVMAGGLVL